MFEERIEGVKILGIPIDSENQKIGESSRENI